MDTTMVWPPAAVTPHAAVDELLRRNSVQKSRPVGLAVGTGLGIIVGSAVGLAVGSELGVKVGLTEGAVVGNEEGAGVGGAVGSAVGRYDTTLTPGTPVTIARPKHSVPPMQPSRMM